MENLLFMTTFLCKKWFQQDFFLYSLMIYLNLGCSRPFFLLSKRAQYFQVRVSFIYYFLWHHLGKYLMTSGQISLRFMQCTITNISGGTIRVHLKNVLKQQFHINCTWLYSSQDTLVCTKFLLIQGLDMVARVEVLLLTVKCLFTEDGHLLLEVIANHEKRWPGEN